MNIMNQIQFFRSMLHLSWATHINIITHSKYGNLRCGAVIGLKNSIKFTKYKFNYIILIILPAFQSKKWIMYNEK